MKAFYCLESILILLVFTSCKDDLHIAIESAYSNMVESPEKSLQILDSIKDYRGNINKRLSARFALLYSQALDKNYIDVTDDSLINIAVSYYSGRKASTDRLLSYYYRGRVRQNNGEYPQAIIDFIKAEEDAIKLKDWLYAGLVNRGMSEIYSQTYNFSGQLEASKKSLEYFILSGTESHTNYALLDLGIAYSNNSYRDSSETIYKKVIEIAKNKGEKYLLAEALDRYGHLEFLNEDYDRARYIWEYNIHSMSFNPNNWRKSQLAISYKNLNDMINYNRLLDEIPKSEFRLNMPIMALLAYDNFRDGNFEYSSTLYKRYADMKDSLFRKVMRQSVDASLKHYYKDNYIIALDRMAVNRLIFIFTLTLIILIAIYRIWNNKKSENRYLEMIHEARTELQSRQDKLQEKEVLINELFKSKFELINELGDLHFEYRDSNKDKSIIYNTVRAKIEKMQNSTETLTELERIINKYNKNVAELIKREIPQIKSHDYKLYCYLCVGFTPQLIAVLLGKDVRIVYDRKYKLKKMIASTTQEKTRDILLNAMK